MADAVNISFPDIYEEFLSDYSFRDHKEVYTNGDTLIPVFRVKQMLDHYFDIGTGSLTPRITIDPEKEKLLLKCGLLMKSDTMQHVRYGIFKQFKDGVVILPPYFGAIVVPKETELELQFKEEKEHDNE